jgi:hypothetical protein
MVRAAAGELSGVARAVLRQQRGGEGDGRDDETAKAPRGRGVVVQSGFRRPRGDCNRLEWARAKQTGLARRKGRDDISGQRSAGGAIYDF